MKERFLVVNAQIEFTYLTTLLAAVFMIVGVGLIVNAPNLAADGSVAVLYVVIIAVGILYLKDGLFTFIEGARAILEGFEKKRLEEKKE